MNLSKLIHFDLKVFFIFFTFLCSVQAIFSYYYLGAISIPLFYLLIFSFISYAVAKFKKGK